ncbi:MAG: cysteine dioxygenase family protein [Cellulomonas sp.]|nr:cysteine dioxygenase family protein [Cellulomonas sp.]
MTRAPESPAVPSTASVLGADQLPDLPGRELDAAELRVWVRELAADPERWEQHVRHDTGARHFVSLYRDADIDVWLLCWNTVDDTGWHDHDLSSGAVAVTRGAVSESRPRLGGTAADRTVSAGSDFAFGPDHIHRMVGAVDGSVTIHAYSPPLWRMGQYSISSTGVMRRYSVSYADELRPLDDMSPAG